MGSAYQTAIGNLGGIIGIFGFLAKDAPDYTAGYSLCIAFIVWGVAACCVYAFSCWSTNRKRDKAAGVDSQGLTENEKAALGDLSPDYRYGI